MTTTYIADLLRGRHSLSDVAQPTHDPWEGQRLGLGFLEAVLTRPAEGLVFAGPSGAVLVSPAFGGTSAYWMKGSFEASWPSLRMLYELWFHRGTSEPVEFSVEDKRLQDVGHVMSLVVPFVSEAVNLPQVTAVLLELRGAEDARVWTVISAPKLADEPRNAVYEAEQRALEQAGGVSADFRLINELELSEGAGNILPAGAIVLFRRLTKR